MNPGTRCKKKKTSFGHWSNQKIVAYLRNFAKFKIANLLFILFSIGKTAFHFLVVIANTAGIFFDPNLLYFVTTLAFAGSLYVEGYRFQKTSRLEPDFYKSYLLVTTFFKDLSVKSSVHSKVEIYLKSS